MLLNVHLLSSVDQTLLDRGDTLLLLDLLLDLGDLDGGTHGLANLFIFHGARLRRFPKASELRSGAGVAGALFFSSEQTAPGEECSWEVTYLVV